MNKDQIKEKLYLKSVILRQIGTIRQFDKSHDTFSIGPLVNIDEHTHIIYITAYFLKHVVMDDINYEMKVDVLKCLKIDLSIDNKSTILESNTEQRKEERLLWEIILGPLILPKEEFTEVLVTINFNEMNEPKRGTRVILPK